MSTGGILIEFDTDLLNRFEDMNQLLTAQQLHPVVDKVFAFEQAVEAYEYFASQKHVGKVVVKL